MVSKPKKNRVLLVRRVFINKKTGQASITLPKKKFVAVPKKVRVRITW